MASAIFMILALLWLTVSAPFVFENQKNLASSSDCTQSPFAGSEEENGGQSGNTTEEKTSKSLNNFSEEYLHDNIKDHIFSIGLQYHKHQDAEIYIAYHGEPLVPPPNVA
jgi:hypothetical protein